MRAFAFLAFGLATLGLASCSPGHKGDKGRHDDHGDGGHGRGRCISRREVNDMVEAYASIVGAFTEDEARHWLADDWVDYSDSINTFVGKEFGAATFNKESFIASQSAGNLPPTPITILGEPVVDCNRVSIVWSSTFGKGWPSRGLTIVEVGRNDKGDGRSKWLMKRWDVEFNSLVWAYDMGQYYCLFGQGYGEASACGAPKARGLE